MRAFSVSLLAILAVATAAHADDLADCSQRLDLQRTIDGCTGALESGALSDRLAAMALNNRANAHGAMAAYASAIADYDKAIAIDPDYGHSYFNRGSTHLEAGRNDLAIIDFTRALQIDPGLVQAFINRGLAELNSGLLDLAINDFTAALALEPHSAITYNNRGVAHRRKGQFAEAIADFESALRLAPEYRSAFNNRAETSAEAERMEVERQHAVASDAMLESIRRKLLLQPDAK